MGDGFVGRAAELNELGQGLDQAMAGRGSVFLISGDAGIGKTRLATEIARAATERGASVHWGHAWDGGAPAFWPWLRILTSLEEALADDPSVVAQLRELSDRLGHPSLQDGAPSGSSGAPLDARFALFDRYSRLLRQLSQRRPLILVLDDVHACDLPSLALLGLIARDVASSAILVLATAREAESATDSRRGKLLLDVARWAKRVRLGRVSEAEAAELIESGLDARASPVLLRRIYQLTEGNPFFIDEVARLLRSRQALHDAEAVIHIPPAIDTIISERLVLLSPEVRRVLTAAAVVGRELDLERLGLATGISADDLEVAIAEAERFHVVERQPQHRERLNFTHVLLRDALYEGLAPTQRHAVHLRFATSFEARYARLPMDEAALAELAYHYRRAGVDASAKAVDYAERAGHAALAAFAYEPAADHFAAALEALPTSGDESVARRCQILLAKGEAHARAMESDEARPALLAVIQAAREADLPVLMARATWILGTLDMGVPRGKIDDALVTLLDSAIHALEDRDRLLRARLLSRLAMELHYGAPEERRRALADEAVAIAEREGDSAALAYTLSSRHFALWDVLPLDELVSLAEQVVRHGERVGDLEIEMQGRTWRLLDLACSGEAERVDRDLEVYRERAEALRQPRYLGMGCLLSGVRALWRGEFDQVEQWGQQAIAAGERVGRPEIFANAGLLSFVTRVVRGRLDEAEPLFQMIALRAPSAIIRLCLEALLRGEAGSGDDVRRVIGAVSGERHGPDVRSWRAWFISCTSAAAVLAGDDDYMTWLYELGLSEAGHHVLLGPNAYLGPYDHHLGVLAAGLGRIDDARAHFERAIELSRATQGIPWLTRSQLAYARLLREHDGRAGRRHARSLLTAAAANAEAVGMPLIATQVHEEIITVGNPVAEPVAASTAPACTAEAVFRLEGEVWTVAYAARVDRVRDRKGMRYLAELLRQPGRDVHVLELAALCDPPPLEGWAAGARELSEAGMAATRDVGRVALRGPSAAEREQLRDIADRLEIAQELGDRERVAELEAELLRIAASAEGFVNAQARAYDVVRQNVSRALKSAIDLIGAHNPDLKLYLDATIKKGRYCSYRPDRRVSVRWRF